MNVAAQIAVWVVAVGALADAPGFGSDALRLPVMIAAAALLLAAGAARREPDRAPPLGAWIAAGAFFAAHLLSSFRAVDVWAALASISTAGTAFVLFCAVARGWVATDRILEILAGAAGVVGLRAVLTGWEPPLLGNPNYAGCACSILATASLAVALLEGPRARRVLGAAGTALALAGLLASESRAGLVGFTAGAVVLAAAVPGRRLPRIAVAAGLVLALGLVAPGRVASIFSTEQPSNRLRLELWKGTLDLARSRPFTGAGAGNFRSEYPRFRRESEAVIQNSGRTEFTEAEDPHNTHLSVAAELGLPGTIAWVALLASLGLAAFRGRTPLAVAGLAGLAAFVAAGSFNTLRNFSAFDGLFGLLAGMAASGGPPAERRPALPAAIGLAAALAALVPALMGAVAQKIFDGAMRTSDPGERVARLDSALAASPGHWRARYELANALRVQADADPGQEQELRIRALAEYERALQRRPGHVAALNFAFWTATLARQPDAAARYIEEAEKISSWSYLTQYHLAFTEQSAGGARGRLLASLQINPRFAPAAYRVAQTYLADAALKAGLKEEEARMKEQAATWMRSARALGFDLVQALEVDHPELREDPVFRPLFEEAPR